MGVNENEGDLTIERLEYIPFAYREAFTLSIENKYGFKTPLFKDEETKAIFEKYVGYRIDENSKGVKEAWPAVADIQLQLIDSNKRNIEKLTTFYSIVSFEKCQEILPNKMGIAYRANYYTATLNINKYIHKGFLSIEKHDETVLFNLQDGKPCIAGFNLENSKREFIGWEELPKSMGDEFRKKIMQDNGEQYDIPAPLRFK